jgi:class 3 adenylate cyclase
MQCADCAAEVPEQNKFCGHCGSAIARRCSTCGAENLASNKFCSDCGTKLTADFSRAPAVPDSRPVERRQLTVLFCDLVGSTTLSARLDPEDFSAIIAAYRRCITETVCRFDLLAAIRSDLMQAHLRTAASHVQG